jgi:hypothetical protein
MAQKEIHLRSKIRLLKRIVLAMDGTTRYNDELLFMLEGRWDVISVFLYVE